MNLAKRFWYLKPKVAAVCALILWLGYLAPSPGVAASYTLIPTDDAMVWSANPDYKYGGNASLTSGTQVSSTNIIAT